MSFPIQPYSFNQPTSSATPQEPTNELKRPYPQELPPAKRTAQKTTAASQQVFRPSSLSTVMTPEEVAIAGSPVRPRRSEPRPPRINALDIFSPPHALPTRRGDKNPQPQIILPPTSNPQSPNS